MPESYTKIPINIKRRAVSVVRSFPKGCGSKVTKLEADDSAERNRQLEPLKDSESLGHVVPEAENHVKIDALGRLEPAHDEGVKVNGQVEEELDCLKKCDHGVFKEEDEPQRPDKLVGGDVGELMSTWKKCENGEKLVNASKRLLVIKRRKVSIDRQFPPGCGRGVFKINSKGEDSGSILVASSESKVISDEKKLVRSDDNGVAASREHRVEAMVKGSVVNELHQKAEDVVEEKNGKIDKSPKIRSLDGKQKKPICGVSSAKVSKEDIANSPKSKKFVLEKRIVEDEGLSAGRIKGEANGDGYKQIKLKAKEVTGKFAVTLTKMKSSDGEKKPVVKRKSAAEGSLRVSSDAKVETEVKKNISKKLKGDVRDSSGEDHVKLPLNSHSSESMFEEPGEEKPLISYSSRKRFERDDVELVRKIQLKELRDPWSSFEADNVVKSLVVKPVDKGYVESPMHFKPLKRKLPDEADDEFLKSYGDQLLVQALMPSENCPRRKGKKSSGVISNSVTPKIKVKKELKLLGRKYASVSRLVSNSQHKSTGDTKDRKDSLPKDGGNEKALTTYKGSHRLCITMTPSVPSGPYCKGSSSSSEEAVNRNRVKKALRLFQLVSRKLLQGEEAKSKDQGKIRRVDLAAACILKKSNEWVNRGEKFIGNVPGVEVGDEFHYRVELSIIGIHGPFQGGIDTTKRNDTVLATSIVASGGYPDEIGNSDILIYSGSGDKQAGDQKLERGNLALKNSIDARTPVRVVYGSKELIKGDSRAKMVSTFTYDGLYLVENYRLEKGPNNFNVFKFHLRKMPGQPEIALKELIKTKKLKVREGLRVKDISGGKENMPICVVNTVDDSQPPPFKYITKVMYRSRHADKSRRGCNCTDGCLDSEKCACAVKNGGELPFNFNGAIVQTKALVFECGPSCNCPPSCHNRVSQHGISLPLEIFKTKTRGWGVRSLYSIPSGTFICEYIGELLEESEAEQRVNDEYLFDIGHNYDDHALLDGLPSIIPGIQSSAACETVEDAGFTIDAAELGNVGRFINHSCSPNLYAQNVLYDHDDKRMPHIMFFAIDNIPPLQELTYHYNYKIDQVRDSEGNIKKKECYCGSPQCTGRLY